MQTILFSLLSQQCLVPTYLLPLGSSTRDFICVFDFDELIEELNRGRLMRPKLEIWAGRPDIDRFHLSRRIKNDFLKQFELSKQKFMAKTHDSPNTKLKNLNTQKEEIGQAAEQSLKTAVSSAIGGFIVMQFFSNPLFYLALFGTAIYSGVDGAKRMLNYFYISYRLSGNKRKIEQEKAKLEAELSEQSKSFRHSLKKIDIKIHPVLQKALAIFYQIENKSFTFEKITPSELGFPCVKDIVKDSDYLQEVKTQLNKKLARDEVIRYLRLLDKCLSEYDG